MKSSVTILFLYRVDAVPQIGVLNLRPFFINTCLFDYARH